MTEFLLPNVLLTDPRKRMQLIIREVLSDRGGVKRDVVLLNAAAGLVAGGKAQSLRGAIEMARESIRSGGALSRLERLIALTRILSLSA